MLIKNTFISYNYPIMSSDNNVYMINDDGQIVLMQNGQPTVSNSSNVLSSQVNSPVVQNNTLIQPPERVNRTRNSSGVRYTQNTQNVQIATPVQQQVQQPVYQRPQTASVYQKPQLQRQSHVVEQPVYQRPQPNAPVLSNRTLNVQRQDESVSFNNWKKMNLSMNQMINDQNPYQRQQNQQMSNNQVNDDVVNEVNNAVDDGVNDDVTEQNFVPNSNRARYGTFMSNNTSHNTRNHGSVHNKNITSYLAIRKANNNENIYL